MDIMNIVMSQLQNGGIQDIAGKLGIAPEQAQQAVNGALPSLLGGLANQAQAANNAGDNGFMSMLDQNNDGSVMDDIMALVAKGGPNSGDVTGLVSSLLGGKTDSVVNGLSQSAGINPAQAGGLMSMIAPMVMNALSQSKGQGGLDLAGIAGMLGGQKQQAQQHAEANGMGGLLGMLDMNGDGSVMDDAMGLLGKFMK